MRPLPCFRPILLSIVILTIAVSLPLRAFSSFGRWASSSVLIYINPQNLDVSMDDAEAAILAAMHAWNTRGGADFRFLYAGRTTDNFVVHDAKNVVMFRDDDNGSVLATTYSWLFNGVLIESDIVFWDGGWTFFTGTTGCVNGMYIEDVGTHELGHALGLGHSFDPSATMFSSVTSLCSQHWRLLAPDDVAAVQALYGVVTSNQPPSVSIAAPTSGSTFTAPASFAIAVHASDLDGAVTGVTVEANGTPIRTDSEPPYEITLNDVGAGSYTLTAVATDNAGATSRSAPITVHVQPPPEATVSFAGRDTTTRGSWQGVYGAAGHLIVTDSTNVPAGVAVTTTGQQTWTWEYETGDVRALERATAIGRLAATWYGSVFTINVSVGATPRRVGLFAVDWDFQGRSQQIDVLDATTGALLDSRTLTEFTGGEYWAWNVTGAVRFRVTQLEGVNAVISGMFIDPVAPAGGSSTAMFVERDTATRGNWQGTYGRDGYVVVGDGAGLAEGIWLEPRGQLEWTWTPWSDDPRALERVTEFGRLAATWYGGEFLIDVGTGASRRVALYAIDWDGLARVQRIDVLDAVTGTLLDSRTLTGFSEGEYWVWQVSGSVRFRITALAWPNAVVSGVFFDPAAAAASPARVSR